MSAEKHTQVIRETMGLEELASVVVPIAGEPAGKDLLSMTQVSTKDIQLYIGEAEAAERIVHDPQRRGLNLLPFVVMTAVMRQASTRTGGSVVTATHKLGATGELFSGMHASAEAKGESLADSWLALATQADIIGTRTAEEYGPHFAAYVISQAVAHGKLSRKVPIKNLGDGTNEHPTQALGDLLTIQQHFGKLAGLALTVVGDHERYRAGHSIMLGAAEAGMNITAVESLAAPVPTWMVDRFGNKLERTTDLDAAMRKTNVLYVYRNPDEYAGDSAAEKERSRALAEAYEEWIIDYDRLQQMSPDAIGLHPRPRRNELHPSVDVDPRMVDVRQMENMIPMRMAIAALHMGKSIVAHEAELAEAGSRRAGLRLALSGLRQALKPSRQAA